MAATGAISAIPVVVFRNYIVEKLRRTNPFLARAFDESAAVLGGAVVHIPQAGASPAVVKNRKTFPATAVQRADSFVSYTLDVFSTDPQHITWHEANEISYDKTDSVLNDQVATLVEAVGDNMLYAWVHGLNASGAAAELPAAMKIATTGAAVDATEAGQTGQRKAFSYKDLQAAQAMMNKQGVPKEGRVALLESYMYQQLIDSLNSNQMAAFQQSADLKNGVVGRFAGFDIMERGTVLAFSAAGAVKVPGEDIEATDNLAALCWQEGCVAKALGDVKPFQDTDNPMYYGDIFSALVKSGGRARRGDWCGVVAIVQSAVQAETGGASESQTGGATENQEPGTQETQTDNMPEGTTGE